MQTTVTMLRATIELSPHNTLEAFLDVDYSDGTFKVARVSIGRGYAGASMSTRREAFAKVGQWETNISASMRGCAAIPVQWAS